MTNNNVNSDSLPLKRRKKKQPSKILWFILFTLVIFLGIYSGYQLSNLWIMGELKNDKNGENSLPIPLKPKDKKINILVLGSDKRPNEPARSDTIIVVSIDKDKDEVRILSVPRDTRVNIPGRGMDKINHAYAYGGPELLTETVEKFLDISINNYVETNFQGFTNIIDSLGGITINVEKRMYYPDEDIDLKKGLQKLDGKDALAYVRFRSDQLGDIGRIQRQQHFMDALYDHVFSANTLLKIPQLVDHVVENVHTNLGVRDVLSMANYGKSIDKEKITTKTVEGNGEYINGVSYWIADINKSRDFIKGIEETTVATKTATVGKS